MEREREGARGSERERDRERERLYKPGTIGLISKLRRKQSPQIDIQNLIRIPPRFD